MAYRDTPPTIEHEILDRPVLADGWTFSCCESVSDEGEDTTALTEIEDEVLDRPWQADGFYTICCTMGISPEDEILDRPKSARFTANTCTIAVAPERTTPVLADGVPATAARGDRMVDTMLRAGSGFGD
ncbi:MAG: hypothetical protein JSR24_21450 [Proteobacteria bacterium]|nr:hypothetical protein [Pseudomonadota bacterium]